METSNWIALGALIVTIVGLIPQFHSIFTRKKRNSRTAVKKTAKAEAKREFLRLFQGVGE